MEMQDPPPNPNHNPGIPSPQTPGAPLAAAPPRGGHHRRAHSEVNFRIPEDLDLGPDPFDNGPSGSFEDFGSEDDLLSTYMDIEKFGSKLDDGHGPPSDPKPDDAGGGDAGEKSARPRHRYSNSVDSSSILESIEAKKAMAPDKLAELWTIDPKRAKRILANRAVCCTIKREKSPLTLFQRDTTGLTAENTELKLRLQAMEQQAQLRDALNEALKKEVERLKVATGEAITPSDTYNLGLHHIPYAKPSYFPHQPQSGHVDPQNLQMSQFHMFQPNMAHQPLVAAAHSNAFSEMMQQDSLGRFQGLDINNKGSQIVKSEAPSISASASSSTF
ncbi:hypothetical protein NL676_036854 [Syzygium grande]|nr:hypothetical protein NL676_036854 [Syzygium grande]